jgi:hypothetical protein
VIAIDKLKNYLLALNDYIVTEYVHQHAYSESINFSSVNTIRVLCVYDYVDCEFVIPVCFHRFGCNNSFVDNMSSNSAIMTYVDVDTGKTGKFGFFKNEKNLIQKEYDLHHPNSHMSICDLDIPNWFQIKKEIIKIMNTLTFLKYVGVDIVVTQDGFKIIEMNSLPSLVFNMAEEKFLNNDLLRNFYKIKKLL